MSDSTVYNLLKSSCFMPSIANSRNASSTMYALGADGWVRGAGADSRAWTADNAEWYVELPAGAYALLYEVDGKQGHVWDDLAVYVGDVFVSKFVGHHNGPYASAVAFELSAASTVHVLVKCFAPAKYRLMLVKGTTAAAWAPAEGEELAGGGAQMSANLLAGVKPTLMSGTTESGGVWHNDGRTSTDGHEDWLVWDLAGQSALATNQTYHVGLSVKGATSNSMYLRPTIGYKDAAGHKNWAVPAPLVVGTSWGRTEATIVVPSGMTPFAFYVAAYGTCPETWMVSPTLSYGSPVTLASSAHTPYATQDHVAAEYSTKASQKILSDSITSEVKARAKTDGEVSELSSKMEQTVNGINVSLDKLTATEKQIHSWFDFGSDASGNPKLAMGSSSSPIIGEYSNTGTTYKDRSGATLLALDAANSTTGADHMVSKDISIGKWQWVPTNSGNNLTLVWKG